MRRKMWWMDGWMDGIWGSFFVALGGVEIETHDVWVCIVVGKVKRGMYGMNQYL